MSIETTQKTVKQYFESDHSDLSMMADDVVFTIMATGQQHSTPEGVGKML